MTALQLKTVVLILAAFFLCQGCSTLRQLESFKEDASRGNWQQIANSEVTCKSEDEGCNQLHLIKGDACYRLAKQNTMPPKNYQCAADELEIGIRHTVDWAAAEPDLGPRAQYYENWCESLRRLRGQQTSNNAAIPYNQRLLACAREFQQAPGQLQPAATYFLHNAELAAIRFQIDDPGSCRLLQRLQQDEALSARQAARSRYAELDQRLLNDISGILSTVPRCP